MNFDTILNGFNTFAWITSNLLVAYIAAVLVVFVLAYYILFDPGATSAGKRIFRFILSLVGIIGLLVVSLFVNPQEGRMWFQYPGDVLVWRPALRLIVYAYVAWTVSDLVLLLAVRKWWPDLIRTALDRELVKPRHDRKLFK